jgi:penicillin amidase
MKVKFRPRVLAPVSLLFVLVLVLDRPIGEVPSLARILNPFSGLWRVPVESKLVDREFKANGLDAPVKVIWDDARVPHIQARSFQDAYWAQGFVHASQRYFQMDLQARAGSSRLADLLGERGLSMDETFIRIGLREATRRTAEKMFADPETKAAVEAYVAGVNHWVKTIGQKYPPSEYRVLSVTPQEWPVDGVASLFVMMSFRLAGRTYDLALTRFKEKYGREKVEDLFPEFLPPEHESPYAKDFVAKIPAAAAPAGALEFKTSVTEFPTLLQPFQGNGSNSWAIGPKLSRTGRAIVANDTHLGFSLPSIWFEQQIEYPGVNVYGAGFAGSMGVLVGFTKTSSWAVTNGTTDVADWYEVKFKDEQSLDYDTPEGTKTAKELVEVIPVKGAKPLTIRLLWTELGPVVTREKGLGLVLKWTVHDGGNPLETFRKLNAAKNFRECMKAVETFFAPVQNFICADSKDIGIVQAGGIPVRWKEQGRYVMNGADPDHRWKGYHPFDQLPSVVNPPEGFVYSANQKPVPAKSGFYMGWDSEEALRGIRVFEELAKIKAADPADMMNMQKNLVEPLAREALPVLLRHLKAETRFEKLLADQLGQWDFKASIENWQSTVFHTWWAELSEQVWSDQLGDRKGGRWPKNQRLLLALKNLHQNKDHPDSYWLNDMTTEAAENLDDVATASFRKAIAALTSNYGEIHTSWKQAFVRPAKLKHIARIPGFGERVPVSGSKYAINAMQTEHGPGWRMVVALGDSPAAWTSVSSTTAGEPLSFDYSLGLKEWGLGMYKEAIYFEAGNPRFRNQEISQTWIFTPEH